MKILFVIDRVELKYFEFNDLVTNFWLIKEFLERGNEVVISTIDMLSLFSGIPYTDGYAAFLDGDNICYDKFLGANMPDVSYKVTYVVSCYDDKNELYVKTEPETLTVCFAKQANVRPEFFFIPFEKYDDGVEYDATVKEPIEIGYLHVANSGSLMMSPTINVRFKVTAKDSDGEDLPGVFTLGEHCPTVNPWNYCSELNPDGTSVSHVNSVRLAPNEYKVSCLDSNLDSSRTNVCSQPFPLLFNMAALKNPDSDEKITLSVQYYYEKTGMPVSLSPELNETIRICLRRNQSMMDLEVVVEDFEGETVIAKTESGSALGDIQKVDIHFNFIFLQFLILLPLIFRLMLLFR